MSTLIERLRDYEKNCGDLGVNFYGRQIKELREALEAKDKEIAQYTQWTEEIKGGIEEKDKEIAELRTQIEEQGAVDYVLDANAKEIASLRAALQGLVDRLDYIHFDPAYKSVWTVHQLHCGPYQGPTYTVDLEKARAALERK